MERYVCYLAVELCHLTTVYVHVTTIILLLDTDTLHSNEEDLCRKDFQGLWHMCSEVVCTVKWSDSLCVQ